MPTKKVKPKAAPKRATKAPKKATGTTMGELPADVREWIERASATINHLRGQVERLKDENVELKAYQKWAERKITVVDQV